MLDRPDLVLAAIPVLAFSGFALRAAIATTGVATELLAAPLATIGTLAAAGVVCWELFARAPDDVTG